MLRTCRISSFFASAAYAKTAKFWENFLPPACGQNLPNGCKCPVFISRAICSKPRRFTEEHCNGSTNRDPDVPRCCRGIPGHLGFCHRRRRSGTNPQTHEFGSQGRTSRRRRPGSKTGSRRDDERRAVASSADDEVVVVHKIAGLCDAGWHDP